MNRVITAVVLATLNFSFVGSAASLSSRKNSLEQAVGALEKAYMARDLGSLDKQFPRRICPQRSGYRACTGQFTIQMEHSLGKKDRIQYTSFNSFADGGE